MAIKLKGFKIVTLNYEKFTNNGVKINWKCSKESWRNSSLTCSKANFKKGELDFKTVTLRESYLLETIRELCGYEYSKDMLLKEIVMVELPHNEEKAKLITNGFVWDGAEYEYLMSSPSLQKKQEGNFKGVAFFTMKAVGLKNQVETLISLGKNHSLFPTMGNIVLPKITSRFAFASTSAKQLFEDFNFTIVTNNEVEVTEDVLCIADDINRQVERVIKTIPELAEDSGIEVQDGCSVISFEGMKKIQDALGLVEMPSFIQMRQFGGLAIKGILVAFDTKRYFEEHGIKTIKNAYGEDVSVDGLEIIYNTSMAKWTYNFKSTQDYQDTLKKMGDHYRGFGLDSIANNLENVWIMKADDKTKLPPRKVLSNYQLLTNLDLSTNDIAEMAQETYFMYSKVLTDQKSALMFLNMAKTIEGFDEEGEPIIEDDKMIDKLNNLIKADAKILHEQGVRKQLKGLLYKKLKNLKGGKFYIDGAFRTVIQDIPAYMDFICGIEQRPTLEPYEIYATGLEVGTKAIGARNPIAMYGELGELTITSNDRLQKWCGHFSHELVMIDQQSLICQRFSGMDEDGDKMLLTQQKQILKGYIKESTPYNPQDGKQMNAIQEPYNDNSLKDSMLRGRGNFIGSVSNGCAVYSNLSTCEGDITKGFKEKYVWDLMYLRNRSMVAIDIPKSGEKLEIDESILENTKKKPFFFKYRDKEFADRIDWDDNEKMSSSLSRFAHEIHACMNRDVYNIYGKDEMDMTDKEKKEKDVVKGDAKRASNKAQERLFVNYDVELLYDESVVIEATKKVDELITWYNEKNNTIKGSYNGSLSHYTQKLESKQIEQNEFEEKMEIALEKKKYRQSELFVTMSYEVEELTEIYSHQLLAHLVGKRILDKRGNGSSILLNFFYIGLMKNIQINNHMVTEVVKVDDGLGDFTYLGYDYKLIEREMNIHSITESHKKVIEERKQAMVNKYPIENFETRVKYENGYNSDALQGELKLVSFNNTVGLANSVGHVVASIFADRCFLNEDKTANINESKRMGQMVSVELIVVQPNSGGIMINRGE